MGQDSDEGVQLLISKQRFFDTCPQVSDLIKKKFPSCSKGVEDYFMPYLLGYYLAGIGRSCQILQGLAEHSRSLLEGPLGWLRQDSSQL